MEKYLTKIFSFGKKTMSSSWSRNLVLSILVSICVYSVGANAQNIRLGGDLGFGQGTLASDGATFVQGPATFSVYGEYAVHSHLLVGVHHLRTLKNDDGELSTAIAFTGLTSRWYPLAPMPHRLGEEATGRAVMTTQDFTPFLRGSVGFEQASVRATTFAERGKGTSVGIYLGLDGGVEYPITGSLGLSSQIGFYQTIMGTGTVSLYNLTVGLYNFF
jgi:hypothetical protein